MIKQSPITCHTCHKTFFFYSHNPWKYYYKNGQERPTSDFYQLYCQPPFPNYEKNVYLHCRHCLVYFHHAAWTDEEGKQRDEAIYIDKNGLCLECRNGEEHLNHACLFSKTNRVWGTKNSWEGLFTSASLPSLIKVPDD